MDENLKNLDNMGEGSDSDVMEVEPPVSSTATITVPNAAQQPGPQRTAAPVEQTTPKDCMTNKWYDGQLVKAHSLVRAPTLNGQMFMVSKRDAGNEPTMTLDRVPVKLYVVFYVSTALCFNYVFFSFLFFSPLFFPICRA